jgi:hypothetical protein
MGEIIARNLLSWLELLINCYCCIWLVVDIIVSEMYSHTNILLYQRCTVTKIYYCIRDVQSHKYIIVSELYSHTNLLLYQRCTVTQIYYCIRDVQSHKYQKYSLRPWHNIFVRNTMISLVSGRNMSLLQSLIQPIDLALYCAMTCQPLRITVYWHYGLLTLQSTDITPLAVTSSIAQNFIRRRGQIYQATRRHLT